jgi:hypothetical protein
MEYPERESTSHTKVPGTNFQGKIAPRIAPSVQEAGG